MHALALLFFPSVFHQWTISARTECLRSAEQGTGMSLSFLIELQVCIFGPGTLCCFCLVQYSLLRYHLNSQVKGSMITTNPPLPSNLLKIPQV
ncbi:uncharacterized protein K444DRAFT_273747 [Hyaloscypha bicolor E]|uniref:Uncharacterized protein n=1 Tax=Hyaloscypha bicolor E TaxID=1095630 RepID=A0A2J6SIR6_9HELO|nr:uncharacterized protein K444DRAFT_273747 [Hyaloscypha bicolor E]PMD50630.1 hypothetical protein K444DRAFT_273747 [Hyaloscypha bicolor E]